jgi:hypothetical protein
MVAILGFSPAVALAGQNAAAGAVLATLSRDGVECTTIALAELHLLWSADLGTAGIHGSCEGFGSVPFFSAGTIGFDKLGARCTGSDASAIDCDISVCKGSGDVTLEDDFPACAEGFASRGSFQLDLDGGFSFNYLTSSRIQYTASGTITRG